MVHVAGDLSDENARFQLGSSGLAWIGWWRSCFRPIWSKSEFRANPALLGSTSSRGRSFLTRETWAPVIISEKWPSWPMQAATLRSRPPLPRRSADPEKRFHPAENHGACVWQRIQSTGGTPSRRPGLGEKDSWRRKLNRARFVWQTISHDDSSRQFLVFADFGACVLFTTDRSSSEN
jgi:hypothetical protein